MTRYFILWTTAAITLAAVLGCSPNAIKDLTPEDSQVFITDVRSDANWSSYSTFSLADSVFTLNNQRAGIWNDSRAPGMTNSVANNLSSRGYKRVERHQKPDLGVSIIGISNVQNDIIANPNPWGWGGGWGGGWGPGWGWGPAFSVVQSSEVYWYVEIIDLKNATPGQTPRALWNAQIRGNGILDESLFNNMIGAIFAQSAYMKR
ncbi:MAG: DUF4136 domain-containing protein [Cytophagia bacterium]|nr:MAG: DUF4136 domain-containing protein [Runella sp.]TAG19278.1 MAG: DUF4136 domain-containing protein [Cytophagales bacterium]TAG38532.1 MAG: DUF4136 domain-containing protein [Cytophagia bacterium]TAG71411.1 MAG: DUF4136 domain-containing protein [Runella slithyformis]TAG80113.1 MAG: DUF4136 domain-containing protein [Cytophagales bacterium]